MVSRQFANPKAGYETRQCQPSRGCEPGLAPFESLRTHASREAAIQYEKEAARRNARAPLAESRQGDRRTRKVARISVVCNQFMCAGAVAGESYDYDVVGIAGGERIKAPADFRDRRAFEKKWRDPDDVYIDVERREEERKKLGLPSRVIGSILPHSAVAQAEERWEAEQERKRKHPRKHRK